MAIKGKTKTRSGGRPAARPPRLEPVEVKPPFFARTRVKVALGILAGIAVSAFAVWIWVGLRSEHRNNAAAQALAKHKAIVASYQATIDGIVSQVGTANGPTVTLFTDISTPLSDLAKGTLDSNLISTVKKDEKKDAGAVKSLTAVDINATFGGKGFDVKTINYAFNSQKKMQAGLQIYQKVFDLMLRAAAAKGNQITALAKDAQDLQATANSLFNDGYSDYSNLKDSVGLIQAPQGLGGSGGGLPPGLPGGS